MRIILEYLDRIEDELCNAKEYAEFHLLYKADNNAEWSERYKEMADDELKHAKNINEVVTQKIKELKRVYNPPEKMQDIWNNRLAKYMEQARFIKEMLSK